MSPANPTPNARRNSPYLLTGGVVLLISAAFFLRAGNLASEIVGSADRIAGLGLIAIGALELRRAT